MTSTVADTKEGSRLTIREVIQRQRPHQIRQQRLLAFTVHYQTMNSIGSGLNTVRLASVDEIRANGGNWKFASNRTVEQYWVRSCLLPQAQQRRGVSAKKSPEAAPALEIAPATPEINTPDRKDQKPQQAASRQSTANTRKPLEQKLAKLETEMKTLTTERDKIVQWLATEEAYLEGSKPRLQEMLKRQGEVVTLLADVEWKWFNCAAEAGSGWLSNILMLG